MNFQIIGVLVAIFLVGCASTPQAQPQRGPSPAEVAAKAAVTPPYSEEKNAASGFVGTQNFYIGRMAATCKSLLGAPESFPKDTVAKWQARAQNGTFYKAMVNYTSSLISSIPDPLASVMLLQHIQGQVQTNGQAAVDNQVKGSDTQKLQACKTFTANIESGALDIKKGSQFFATLEGIVREFGAK